jgi:hypothetical protein
MGPSEGPRQLRVALYAVVGDEAGSGGGKEGEGPDDEFIGGGRWAAGTHLRQLSHQYSTAYRGPFLGLFFETQAPGLLCHSLLGSQPEPGTPGGGGDATAPAHPHRHP